MSRPKTKGDSISLRLPIEHDRKLREFAEAKNETPAEVILRVMGRSLDAQ